MITHVVMVSSSVRLTTRIDVKHIGLTHLLSRAQLLILNFQQFNLKCQLIDRFIFAVAHLLEFLVILFQHEFQRLDLYIFFFTNLFNILLLLIKLIFYLLDLLIFKI